MIRRPSAVRPQGSLQVAAVELALLVEPAWLSRSEALSTVGFYPDGLPTSSVCSFLTLMANAHERRCRATNRRGERCAAKVVNAEGLCAAHSGRTDMRELGRKSGEARRRPDPGRVPEGLRDYLRREVPPERVWQALEAAMLGSNEAARVSASKVLIDALSEGRGECQVCRDRDAEASGARAKLAALLLARADPDRRGPEDPAVLRERVDELEAELADERARLRALREEHGLVA